jgi:DNA-binding transcriptional LysR family regulator
MVQKQTACDWADLPVVLAVARSGTLRAAAKSLRVSHSTVLRRLEAIEANLGTRVFERTPNGRYGLTPAGHDAFETAQHLEEQVQVMERRIHGRDLELAGPLHVTMPSALLPVLGRDVAAFCDAYPKIDLSLSAGFGFVDLAHREADVALRITPTPSPELVGRRLVDVPVGIYGSVAYLEARPPRAPLERYEFIGWDAALSHVVFASWMRERVPRARIRCRVTQDWQLKEAVDADLGLALLPCALGDSQRRWRRVRLLRELAAPLWLLTHRDLRATARMRACRDFLAEAVLAKRDLFEGRQRA